MNGSVRDKAADRIIEELKDRIKDFQKEIKEQDEALIDVLKERDEAQEAADEMASLVLGEPIGWCFHDEAWGRAIDSLRFEKG